MQILTYEVSWAFVRLGTITLEVQDSVQVEGIKVQHIRFYLDSNPMLFFIDMHGVYDCYIDQYFRPIKYVAIESEDGVNRRATYNFQYPDSTFTIDIQDKVDTTRYVRKVFPLHETVFDGISLIFYSRKHISDSKTANVTAFFDDVLGRVELNYKGEGSPLEIDAISHKIPAYYVEGEFLMSGIAGVTGPFEGWFAKDSQRPPLLARLKVFVGNVKVELESWSNWSPAK